MTGKNRKSFKFWIDHWRTRVENQYSGNALYLRPDGRPIDVNQYRMLMLRLVKPVFPKFSLYCTRHWCAIGQLIKTKVKLKNFDVYPVRNWLGHSNIQTTMSHLRDAEQYLKLAPYDWFQRVLKYSIKDIIEENTVKSVQLSKRGVLTGFLSRRFSGPAKTQKKRD